MSALWELFIWPFKAIWWIIKAIWWIIEGLMSPGLEHPIWVWLAIIAVGMLPLVAVAGLLYAVFTATATPIVSKPPSAQISSLPTRTQHTPSRTRMPLSLRFAVLRRDGHRCVYCGASAISGAKLEVDHREPVSLGGGNHLSNLVTACRPCNQGKGNRFIT